MIVFIGGEESGTIRDEFIKRGHEAISCDLENSQKEGPHYKGNMFDLIDYPFDLAIFHPECTNTAVSGARYFEDKKKDGRYYSGIAFFMKIVHRTQHIPKVAIEHPVSVISSIYRKPDQIIQPYQFGHPESKKTCLWLKNLSPLLPTCIINIPEKGYWDNQTISGQNKLGPSEERAKIRSKTYEGIAKAMAEQWG